MEIGFEHAHPRHVRQQLFKDGNGLQIRTVVGWGHGEIGPHALLDFLSQYVDAVMILGQHRLEAYRLDGLQGRHCVP